MTGLPPAERRDAMVRWWAEGLTLYEIGQHLGWSVSRVSTEVYLMRGLGYDLPYRRGSRQVKRMRRAARKRRDEARGTT